MGRKKNVDIKMQLCCNVSYYSRNVETTCHQNDIYSNKAAEKRATDTHLSHQVSGKLI